MAVPRHKNPAAAGVLTFLKWLSPRHESHGVPVWTPVSDKQERPLIYERIDAALDLLRQYAPERYRRAVRLLTGLLVLGSDAADASFERATGTSRLRERFVLAADTTAASLACTVVHEATHAWLFELGIPYDEPVRHRVEMICTRAALLAARRFPGADAEVKRCQEQLSIEPSAFSDESYIDLRATNLRELGCPEWFVRAVVWIARRRVSKAVAGGSR